jgi:hypothetical protein
VGYKERRHLRKAVNWSPASWPGRSPAVPCAGSRTGAVSLPQGSSAKTQICRIIVRLEQVPLARPRQGESRGAKRVRFGLGFAIPSALIRPPRCLPQLQPAEPPDRSAECRLNLAGILVEDAF